MTRLSGVPTSTVWYYERRGLLAPDGRVSGQRRYSTASIRRLAFIGVLQDAGLSLDDVDAVLGAAGVQDWKAIARRRLSALNEEIDRLAHARSHLLGALDCPHDHPLTDCTVINAEISRRGRPRAGAGSQRGPQPPATS